MKISNGISYIPLTVAIGIWSVSALTALPGLAITPILGDLQSVFPKASQMEIQLLGSLPSLLIIPFILISGYLTQKVNMFKLLIVGLVLFGGTGVLYLVASKMWQLLIISVLLGIGAGIIVPLSTGLISVFFSGKARTKQLGLNSAISNLTVVGATFVTGFLANSSWKLPFAVYLLPFIALFLVAPIKRHWPTEEKISSSMLGGIKVPHKSSTKAKYGKWGIKLNELYGIMVLYGVLTFIVSVVIFYIPFRVTGKDAESINSFIISLYFLSIMAPGLILNNIIREFKGVTIIGSLLLIVVGFFIGSVTNSISALTISSILIGVGYGIIQPICYDKTVEISTKKMNTLALAFVMCVNYLAILICPIVIDAVKGWFNISSHLFSFSLATSLSILLLAWSLIGSKSFLFTVNKMQ